MKYTVVFEKAPDNYAAFSPDIPGCVSTADTPEAMREMIREAIEFHFECLELDGEPIPEPAAWIETLHLNAYGRYIGVYEKDSGGYAAYIPDLLPACEATGGTAEEVRRNFREAIGDYLAAMERKGEPLPEPSAWAETMEIARPSRVSA